MPRYFVRAAARRELASAFRWYGYQSRERGDEFLAVVRSTLEALARTPGLGSVALDDIRRFSIARFPYVIYYVIEARGVSVLAVIHGRRHPRRWQSRR